MGEQLGLFAALKSGGPATSAQLAERTGCAERSLREWLASMAGAGYVDHDPASAAFAINDEQALVFADPDSPVYIFGAFDNAVSGIENQPRVQAAFRTGEGVAWGLVAVAAAQRRRTAEVSAAPMIVPPMSAQPRRRRTTAANRSPTSTAPRAKVA